MSTARTRWTLGAAAAAGLLGMVGTTGWAGENEGEHCHSTGATANAPPPSAPAPKRYAIPDVRLVRADGKTVRIREVLDGPQPVILNFIFTTCGAICPVMSQTLAKVQDRLGEDRARVAMVSISIDPEQDTPERLTAYARKYAAGPQWSFYTGSTEASVALQKAFGMYRGNKMNHLPVTFVRTTRGGPWVSLEGLGNAEAILSEVRPALAVSDRRHP